MRVASNSWDLRVADPEPESPIGSGDSGGVAQESAPAVSSRSAASTAPSAGCAALPASPAVRGLVQSGAAARGSAALHGYGLRAKHYAQLLEQGPRAPFVEAISENFLGRGGPARALLRRVRTDAEVALHGVSMSLGGLDPLNEDYLRALGALQREIEPRSISDHLCFGTFGGHYGHDLWPLPYTAEAIAHVVERVQRVQEHLGRRILLENVSSYVEYRASVMPEWQFLSEVAQRADALILLDVNNVIVSAKNHGFDPEQYISMLPAARVAQLHLAGHTDYGTHAIDDHGSAVPDAVWQLYEAVVERMGPVPAIVEWDDALPSLQELQQQSELAREHERTALARRFAQCAERDGCEGRA